MNFFNGARIVGEGNTTRAVVDGVGQVEIPPLYAEAARKLAGKNLTLGIRPEDLEDVAVLPAGARDGSSIEAPVDVVEHLGSELLVYARAGGKSLTARVDPRSDVHTGSNVRLHVDSAHIHLFDTDTGESIF